MDVMESAASELNRSPNLAPFRTMRIGEWIALFLILALFVGQSYTVIPRESATFDEQYHLTAGYSYLRTGDYRLASNHPPLMGMLGGLGLLSKQDVNLALDDPAWETGDRYRFSDVFLWETNDRAQEFLVAARRMMLLAGLALLLAIFFATREMVGRIAGWLALLLAAFDPNLLFHTHLVTTDLGVALFLFVAVWLFWRWLVLGSKTSLPLAGLAGGLAMAAKYTGVLLWPLLLLIMLIQPRGTADGDRTLMRRGGGLALAGLLGLVTLWGVFRFDSGIAGALPVPLWLPAPFYWENLYRSFFAIVGDGDPKLFFLLGERSLNGWWYYFPVVFGAKTPLPTLLLIGAGIVVMIGQRQIRRSVALWIGPMAFLLLGMTGYLTIGYRHILPALPFLLGVAGYSAAWVEGQSGKRRSLGLAAQTLCLIWLLVGTARIYPHHGSYFNEMAGPWTNWSNIVVDSNLDWGQDLPSLAEVMDELGIDTVNLAYFGKAVPEHYGVRYRPLPGFLRFMEGVELNAYNPVAPSPGWYAISATSLQLGLQQPGTENLYAYFRNRTPDARAGYSIYLYRIEDAGDEDVRRSVLSGAPAWQRPAEELAGDGRLQVKWVKSPDVPLYPLGEGYSPPGENYMEVEADFGGVMTLLGYQMDAEVLEPGRDLTLSLVWQVGEEPMPMPAPTRGAPLAAFVHLVERNEEKTVAQFDGWPTALAGLEPGDMIVQAVRIPVPAELDGEEYGVRVGLYSPQNWQRLPLMGTEALQDSLMLAPSLPLSKP
jgi:hypothetical protein